MIHTHINWKRMLSRSKAFEGLLRSMAVSILGRSRALSGLGL